MFSANINIAPSNTFGLINSLCNDVVFYTSNPTQRILIGTSNSATLIINSNSTFINTNLGINNSNPLYSVDIIGDLNYNSNLYKNGAVYVGWSNNSSNLWWNSNVAIGKSNPFYTLDVAGNVLFGSNLFVNGAVTVSNTINISSNLYLFNSLNINSNLTVSNMNINGVTTTTNIMPLANLLYDLGSSTMRFRSLYLASNTIDMMGIQLHVDSNGLRVTDSNNNNANIVANQIQLGTTSNIITLTMDSNNNFSVLNVTLSNGIAISSNVSPIASSSLLTVDSNNPVIISNNTSWTTITGSNFVYNPVMTLAVNSPAADYVSCIEIDNTSNIYISGYYTSTGPTIYNSNGANSGLTTTAVGGQGAYIVKYNSNGTGLWEAAIDSTGTESANSIAVDSLNNVIVTGFYTAAPNIYNAGNVLVSTSSIASLGTPSNTAAYIVKYDSNGTALWTTHIDSLGTDNSYSVVCDSANNIYMAGTSSTSNSVIYDTVTNIISTTITVSTIAGNYAGYADGTGTNALFNNSIAICVDSSGLLYLLDAGNQCIRKITQAGVTTTIAGKTGGGYADGTGTNALFSYPRGMCIDSTNTNLYVADTNNNRIRKIVISTGVVTTFAGSGVATYIDDVGTNAAFNIPSGICVDNNGNLYVADTQNSRIRKITPSGVVTTIAGSSSGFLDGIGTNAMFSNPFGIIIDNLNSNLYLTDAGSHRIRKIVLATSAVSIIAGSGTGGFLDGTGTNANFYIPYAVCIDSTNTNLYVADQINVRIRKIVLSTSVVTTYAGSGAIAFADGIGTNASFNYPQGITIDTNGVLYVSEYSHIRKITNVSPYNITSTNSTTSYFPNIGSSTDQTAYVVKYNSSGVSQWAVTVNSSNISDIGASVCVDTSQNIYLVGTCGSNLATIYQNTVASSTTLSASGSNTAFAVKINSSGVPQWAVKVDGTGNDQARGSCVDTGGNLYIAGSYNTSPNTFSNLTASTYTSAFLTKYNTSGVAQWATSIQGISGANIATSVISDTANNIYLTGTYQGTVSPPITDYNGSNSGLILPVPTGNSGLNVASFVVKYNSNGTPLIAYAISGPSNITANSIAVTNSNIYTVGTFFSNTVLYDSFGTSNALAFPGTITTQAGFVAQYSPTISPYYLLNSSSNGFQKYITNASSSNITLKVGTNSYILNSTSNTLFNSFNNSWYRFY
jgi:sugar lactone lactonase YvrE